MKFSHRLSMSLALTVAAALVTQAHAETPPPPTLTFVFEEIVTLSNAITPGKTALGERNIIPITGGTFEGPGDGAGIKGTIIPGGWDWQLVRADGCLSIKADYMLKTDDGAVINVVNQGVACRPADGKPPLPVRTTPVFEPPLGKYQWLGQASFVGTLEPVESASGPAVRIRFYRAG
jgi:hypothetical protein